MIKKILVPVVGSPSDRRALATAFLLADQCRGLVDGLCITPHTAVHTPAESTSIPSALLTQLRRIATEEQARVAAAAHQTFEEFRRHYGGASEGTRASASNQMPCLWR